MVQQGTQLGPERVRAGDAIVGLASPGLRSNGYTLARHVLLERAGLDLGDPAWEGADHSVADELLRPSVIYTPAVLAVRAALGDALHACAHITGGGIVGQPAPGPPRRPGGAAGPLGLGGAARLRRDTAPRRGGASRRWTGCSTVASGWRWWSTPAAADAALAALAEAGRDASVIGEVVAGGPGVQIA